MQLNRSTDYAIQMLLYLAKAGKTSLPSVSFPQSTLSSTLPSCFWEAFTLFFGC